jgi:phosphoglycerol transferase MdoB-like AlkP superfamily enzyme
MQEYPQALPYLSSLYKDPQWVSTYQHLSSSYRTVGAQFTTLCGKHDPSSFYVIRDYPRVPVSCMQNILKEQGYRTLSVTGSFDAFDNVEEWMQVNGFDRILAESSFDKKADRCSYGVHDDFIFQKALDEIESSPKPVFANILTVSTHYPYQVPDSFLEQNPTIKNWGHREQAYFYTDASVRKFMEEAKKRSWYKDTLFILLGDHPAWGSHPDDKLLVSDPYSYYLQSFSVVTLLHHSSLAGMKTDRITNHIDIPATVLSLLGIAKKDQFLGTNLFEKRFLPYVASQENQRDSFFQLADETQIIRSDYKAEACQVFTQQVTNGNACTDAEKHIIKDFKTTFFDTVQWEISTP